MSNMVFPPTLTKISANIYMLKIMNAKTLDNMGEMWALKFTLPQYLGIFILFELTVSCEICILLTCTSIPMWQLRKGMSNKNRLIYSLSPVQGRNAY